MAKKLTVLCVHGLGDHRNSTWREDWSAALGGVFPGRDRLDLRFEYLTYDPLFENVDISAWDSARAFWRLTSSAVGTAFGRRGLIGDVSDRLKWTAGYVVAWVENETFQAQTRALVLDGVRQHRPDLVLAHSLGSLITYNAFSHPDAREPVAARALRRASYVTLGSQIGNPFVIRNLTPGRIEPLRVAHWFHLYNREDDVFTAPIRLWDADNFRQVDTPFDIDGFADHAATAYLTHASAVESVWRPLAERRLERRSFGPTRASRRRVARAPGRRRHRALLVGINDYPHATDRLEGCVNDVFLMSSVLQECGFEPAAIRTCFDARATARGIHERLQWLLDDPRPGDERVFFYSGHGAQIPEYGRQHEPDRLIETLVPHDFDWSPETAVSDEAIFDLYSQLPFGTRVAMIFDCCHSGGIHRDGGRKPKAITPPDDVRHRALKWDSATQMWVPREFRRLNDDFSSLPAANREYFGANGATVKLGRAGILRGLSETHYQRLKQQTGSTPVGPYLPLVIEACAEHEYSYEYRHGVTSYGAFTYALATALRRYRRVTFADLVQRVGAQLAELGYLQTPQILGPRSVTGALVPWLRDR